MGGVSRGSGLSTGRGGPGPPPIAAPNAGGRVSESFGAAEERAATNGIEGVPGSWRWAGGGGGGWGATYVFSVRASLGAGCPGVQS